MLRNTADQRPLDTDLRTAWADLRRSVPNVGHRAAAAALGVSEAELVATGCGESAVRLVGDWRSLLGELPSLGQIVAATRNARAVHEKVGTYDNVHVAGPVGLVLNGAVDLRLFLDHWHMAFALNDGKREGLAFFDADGSAVHKAYLERRSDQRAYRRLVERFASRDQTPHQTVAPRSRPAPERPDAVIDVGGLRSTWANMTDTHQFTDLMRTYGVTRLQALRLAGPTFAHRVPRSTVADILKWAAADGTSLLIYVSNQGTVQIHSGPIHRIETANRWLLVRDDGFRLQLRSDRVASAWVVRKPTRDGLVTSLELFDPAGENVALFFGERKPGFPEPYGWQAALLRLPRVAPAV